MIVENQTTIETMALTERILGLDATAEINAVLARHEMGPRLLLVCDDLTWLAAGKTIQGLLAEEYVLAPHSLGRDVKPVLAHAAAIAQMAADYDGLLAVGAGTINDITKYAAALGGKPYIAIATAASMNGYTSANASLEVDGHKQSFPAQAPRAMIADISIIAQAPKRLARSGLGDTLCRGTVEADVLLSHFLLGTPYPRALFNQLRSHEPTLIARAGTLSATEADREYIALLMTALLDAGDAMAEHGSSAVASQGEHMIAHTAELMYGTDIHTIRHGELVAVATLSMCKLQEQMLLSQPTVKPMPRPSSQFLRVFGKHSADAIEAAYNKKLLTSEQATAINARITAHWATIKQAIHGILIPSGTLQRALTLAGVPTRAQDIRLDMERYQHILTYAYMTRDRFTFLDLAAMNDKRV
jgi:glycerol-1-phosphate dehydrogenase [NAD(P)+]